MRLFAKFFLCSTLVISIALLISGYLLITTSFNSAVERETRRTLNQFQLDRFAVQANIIAHEGATYTLFHRLSSELSGLTAFFSEDRQQIYSSIPQQMDFYVLNNIADNTHIIQFQTVAGSTYIIAGGRIVQSGVTIYFLTANDISDIIIQKDQMIQNFATIYFFTLVISIVVILVLSAFIARPIKKINKAAAKMAQGHYSERLGVSSSDEIGELSKSFNLMADAIEEKIYALSENARQKEDFVANFAHELKTPLTSVIGYADMIYQKSLSSEQIKDAAQYILNEGLRLEALSLKLMDLIVLGRQNFVLEEISAQEFFADVSGSIGPMLDNKNVSLHLNMQPAYIKIEHDLFKTLVFNLIDNAIKANCKRIDITGKQDDGRYSICVSDDGSGIPEAELAKITEAFYTVDKSRSRKQHGAGIGLALSAKIAEIHGSRLVFSSVENTGTDVTLHLGYARKENKDD